MLKELNRERIYGAEDEEETFWRFEFRTIGDITGWWSYRKQPNSNAFLCIGNITEADIIQFLEKNKHPLGLDDYIDLELTMKKIWGSNLPKED